MGMYKLDNVRSHVSKDKLAGLNESGMRNLQMTLLNNYLNGYTQVLASLN